MGIPNRQIGIYKITSPSGKVYIGQSWDIKKRFSKYRSLQSVYKQRVLFNSFKKHTWQNHKFEIIKEFQSDNVTQFDLDELEIYYINFHKDLECNLLNIKEGGRGGKLPKESIDKMLQTRGKWNHSAESKKKISDSHKGIKHSLSTRIKMKNMKNSMKIIFHKETGTFYFGIKEAALIFNLNYNTLCKILQGKIKNNTNLIYI
jgi:group I intron endonuclease